jgi:hypothetical protein
MLPFGGKSHSLLTRVTPLSIPIEEVLLMSPLTRFLSKLIGLFSILVSLSLVTHKQATVDTLTALIHNPPLLLTFGMVWLIAGLAMVLSHNVWSGGALTIIVTLVGWLFLIRGLLLLFLSPAC